MSKSDDHNTRFDEWCAEAEYSELLATMLNEMTNPLSTAQGFAHLIKDEIDKLERSEELDTYVEGLIVSVDRLYQMRQAILDCVKKKADQIS